MDSRFVCTTLAVLIVTVGTALLVNRDGPPAAAPLHENLAGVERRAETPPEDVAQQPDPEPDYAYLIREHEGRIGIFSAANLEEPEMVLDLLVKYLPDYDRTQMQQGIPVRDYEELVTRIEDYMS